MSPSGVSHPLAVHAGPAALRLLRDEGLRASDVRMMVGASGGAKWLVLAGLDKARYPSGRPGAGKDIPVDSVFHDASHPSIVVNLDACIQCGLCVRACREVQVNDVIGMAGRGHDAYPTFDFADPLGESSCVACG